MVKLDNTPVGFDVKGTTQLNINRNHRSVFGKKGPIQSCLTNSILLPNLNIHVRLEKESIGIIFQLEHSGQNVCASQLEFVSSHMRDTIGVKIKRETQFKIIE